jgi:hypothetical protein
VVFPYISFSSLRMLLKSRPTKSWSMVMSHQAKVCVVDFGVEDCYEGLSE